MPIEFTTATHKETYERVAGYMKELFGEFARPSEKDPTFGISSGSVYVQIGVYARGDTDAYVSVWAWMVLGAERSPELMTHLLKMNTTMRFGAFGMDDAGDILFKHAIKGTCDKEQLRNSINAVLYTADDEDDKIVARWGGRRSSDPAK